MVFLGFKKFLIYDVDVYLKNLNANNPAIKNNGKDIIKNSIMSLSVLKNIVNITPIKKNNMLPNESFFLARNKATSTIAVGIICVDTPNIPGASKANINIKIA